MTLHKSFIISCYGTRHQDNFWGDSIWIVESYLIEVPWHDSMSDKPDLNASIDSEKVSSNLFKDTCTYCYISDKPFLNFS